MASLTKLVKVNESITLIIGWFQIYMGFGKGYDE